MYIVLIDSFGGSLQCGLTAYIIASDVYIGAPDRIDRRLTSRV